MRQRQFDALILLIAMCALKGPYLLISRRAPCFLSLVRNVFAALIEVYLIFGKRRFQAKPREFQIIAMEALFL